MDKRSTEEWIAITVAVVVGLGLFVLGFFLFNYSQPQPSDVLTDDTLEIDSDGDLVSSEVPAPGFEDDVDEMIVNMDEPSLE